MFRGLPEDITECDYNLRKKVYQELTHIFEGENYQAKLTMAKNMAIKNAKELADSVAADPTPSLWSSNIVTM